MLKSIAYNVLFTLGIIALIILANLSIIITVFAPSPLKYQNMPFSINSRDYAPGDSITMRVEQCNSEHSPVAVVSVKELYNPTTGSIIALPPGSRIIPPGCTVMDVTYSGIIPPLMDEGTYFIRGVTTFRGSLKTVDIAWQTQPFVYRRN